MTALTIDSMATRLLSMDDYDFKDIVDDDLREEARPEEHEALRSPAVVNRWIAALESSKKSVEGQLAAKRADFEVLRLECEKSLQDNPMMEREIQYRLREERKKHERTRAKQIRFKVGVEQQLIHAHYIRESYSPAETFLREERDQLLRRVWELEAAITRHRERTESEDSDQDDTDDQLWNTVSPVTSSI